MSEEQTDTSKKDKKELEIGTQSNISEEEKPLTEIVIPDFKDEDVEMEKWDEKEDEEKEEDALEFGI